MQELKQMRHLGQEALRIDTTGLPLEWIDYKDAVRLYAVDQVVYTLGDDIYTVFGGINSITGKRSQISVNSIIATRGRSKHFQDKINTTLLKHSKLKFNQILDL